MNDQQQQRIEKIALFRFGVLGDLVHLAPGEDKEKRARSEYATLAKLAEDFREQKRVSFLRFVKGIKDDVKLYRARRVESKPR